MSDIFTPLSWISLPVAQSNVTILSSVLLAGQTTSPLPVPSAHFGIVKFNTAAELVPELVTLALVPAAHVVVVPTVIVAAAQVLHVSHLSHCGIEKFNTAAVDVPELVTVALEPAAPVVTLPTVIVAAVHGSPCSHLRLEY